MIRRIAEDVARIMVAAICGALAGLAVGQALLLGPVERAIIGWLLGVPLIIWALAQFARIGREER